MFTSRHLQASKFKLDTSVNEKDKLATADIKCSNEYFEIDAANIHIKGGAKPLNKRPNGDYSNGKEAGVHFDVTSKLYSETDIKFSVKLTFETILEIKEDKASSIKDTRIPSKDVKRDLKKQQSLKHEKINVTLPYIIDFNLGPAKKPGLISNQQKNVSSNNNNKLNNDNNNDNNGKDEFYKDSNAKARTSKENLKSGI